MSEPHQQDRLALIPLVFPSLFYRFSAIDSAYSAVVPIINLLQTVVFFDCCGLVVSLPLVLVGRPHPVLTC